MAEANELSEATFLGINWMLYSLCVLAFFTRLYIRWICFQRLFLEDYLMVAAMTILIGIESMSQHFSDDIYNLMAFTDKTYTPTNLGTFAVDTEDMLKACGSGIILFIVGFYVIKVNFLLFFYRMGNRLLRIYRIIWWIVFVIVTSCGVISVAIGVTTFKCLFNGIIYTLQTCETAAYENAFFTYFRVSVALDIFTDALIIGFPVWLLWGVRINFRRKLALGGIFSLVGFTIVATILRGALLSEVFASTAGGSTFNIPWVWFWFHIEFCVAYLVACLVSFRALFTQHEGQSAAAVLRRRRRGRPGQPQPGQGQRTPGQYYPGSGPTPGHSGGSTTIVGQGSGNDGSRGSSGMFFRKARLKQFQDSILDTCRTLEGLGDDDDDDERTPVEMERLDSYLRQQPDVVAEQGNIGGLRDIVGGRGGVGGGVEGQVRGFDDYSPREERLSDVERDSQGVSVLDETLDSSAADRLPRRRDTVSTSQLSLDSLYMRRSSESARHLSETK